MPNSISKYIDTKRREAGFTLLEMIVSIGIFTFVAVIAVGSLVRISSLNRQAQSMQSSVNNINYILENMTREMRFGSYFHCTNNNGTFPASTLNTLTAQSCNNFKGIVFKTPKTGTGVTIPKCNLAAGYWLDGTTVKKDQQVNCDDSISRQDAVSLIDTSNIVLTDFDLEVRVGPSRYSFANIRFTGYSGIKENEKSYFDIRTAVSQRTLDLY